MRETARTTVAALGKLFDGPHATPTRRSEGPYFLNIASLKSGRLDLSESDHVSDDDFKRWTKRVVPRPGDLLFSYETRLGEAALMPHGVQACLGRRMALLRPNPTIVEPRFLLYFYLSPAFQNTITKNTIHGATVPRIGLASMPTWDVELPALAEQRAIAEVLGALDDKIAANVCSESLILSMIDALYQRALSSGSAIAKPLFDIFDVDFGEAFKGDQFSQPGTGRPLIRIRDLKTSRPQTWTTEARVNEVTIQPGDVVVGMDAEFRPTWWLGEPGMLNQRVCRVRGRFTGSVFVAQALRKPLAAIENEKTGTTVIHLNKSDLERVKIDMPSSRSLADFEAAGEPLVQSRVAIALENRRLAEARAELLPLLMSGKICVRDAEKIVEEVV